ncbi:MAG: hypothetical protein PHU25_21545 [Deltaproteobacteria bacterium]|nr:hypothetical protein [Deltaproteobacteria bacterium]
MNRKDEYEFLKRADKSTATEADLRQAIVVLAKLKEALEGLHPTLRRPDIDKAVNRDFSTVACTELCEAIERGFGEEGSLDSRINTALNAVFMLKKKFQARLKSLQQSR